MKIFWISAFLCALLVAPAPCAPAPTRLPAQTQKEIEALLCHPALQSAHIGISVVALGQAESPDQFPSKPYDGGVQPLLFDRDGQKRFVPASNMKLFTAAWVLARLGPEKTFQTKVVRYVAKQGVTADGLVMPLSPDRVEAARQTAPLFLTGDGDPSFDQAGIDNLATQIAQSGLKTCGKIYGDGSEFGAEDMGGRYPDGWTLDDTLWYYGPPISALSVNRNQFDATWTGAQPGQDAIFAAHPDPPISIANFVRTVEPKTPNTGALSYNIENYAFATQPQLTITGTLQPGEKITEGLAVPNPEWWAASLLKSALRSKNIATGDEEKAPYIPPAALKTAETLASHNSPPIKALLRQFLKNSDNLYGEVLLRRAALQLPTSDNAKVFPVQTSEIMTGTSGVGGSVASRGLAGRAYRDLLAWLDQNQVPTASLRFSDGSGLSRYNLVTPISVARLLSAVEKLDGGGSIYSALPVAGRDGTLKKRMVGTLAENNVRAKTGTFSIVNCLSGYVTTRDGQRLAVSILTNYVPDGELARRWQGLVMATLAASSWKE